jgi:hypothetical protein
MSYVLPAGMKSAAAFGGLPGRNPGIVPPNLNGNSNVLPPPPAAAAPAPPHIMAAPDAGLGTGPGAPSAAPGTQNFIGDMPPPVAAPAPAAVPTGQFPLNPAAAGGPPPAAGGVPGLQGVPGGVVSSIATALQDGGGDPRRHRPGLGGSEGRFDRFMAGPHFAGMTPEQQALITSVRGQPHPFATLRSNPAFAGMFPANRGFNNQHNGGM